LKRPTGPTVTGKSSFAVALFDDVGTSRARRQSWQPSNFRTLFGQ
jgi:hypothetical protein